MSIRSSFRVSADIIYVLERIGVGQLLMIFGGMQPCSLTPLPGFYCIMYKSCAIKIWGMESGNEARWDVCI